MEAFRFLLISFLSFQIFDVEGLVEPSVMVHVDKKKITISETLPVTIIYRQDYSLPGVCLLVLIDGNGIQPTWLDHAQAGPRFISSNVKEVPVEHQGVTFNCSGTTLFDSPIKVTVAIFSATDDNGCEPVQEQLGNDTALLYDDRGIV